ncbi:NADP-dependent oxidoreductase domain-containing protein [Pseudoneurospora amorphoporcata]|uniref:NADP-dependent oxidoreductase domain-containing protein n=1 Tax=Pseudoneurospora amorphoporcata TaxID=241081 RepID=A0AAN6P055_9PEZI|nr:NADP-dependent oxidoreductase domain-containing protein [Pseudoneurospora amorphoporcata]
MVTIQGKKVGSIGFGLMGLTWRASKLSDNEIFPVIKAALDAGCNYFNGGEFYGLPDHNSLTVLKRYYEKYPEDVDKILLNVKGCMLPGLLADSSPEGVRASIENSVRMIGGKGRIDQFEAARKDPKVDIEVTMKAMQEHIEAGDIRGIALSEVSAQTIRRAAKVAKITAVEVELSIWNTEPLENGVLEACAELGIPVLAYSPLGKGFLTGQVKSFNDIPEGDFRRMLPRFQPEVFETNLRLVRKVEELAARKGCTPAQLAVNWVVALSKQPEMPTIIPIPGASSPERVRENAVEIELTEEDMADIEKILEEFAPVGDRYHKHGMELLDN